MNGVRERRLAAASGIALAAVAALWWLGSSRIASDRGSDASRHAAEVLQSLWLVRGMVLALLGLRVGALHGWRAGAAAASALVAPSWPLVVLAWAASTAPWMHVALAECFLLAASLAVPWTGQGLRRALPQAERAEVAATGVAAALAAAVWLARGLWTLPAP